MDIYIHKDTNLIAVLIKKHFIVMFLFNDKNDVRFCGQTINQMELKKKYKKIELFEIAFNDELKDQLKNSIRDGIDINKNCSSCFYYSHCKNVRDSLISYEKEANDKLKKLFNLLEN